MMNKSIVGLSLLAVYGITASSVSVESASLNPTPQEYEQLVKDSFLKDNGNPVENVELGPIRAYLARAFDKFGRDGVKKMLNDEPLCVALSQSLQSFENPRLVRYELRYGANALAKAAKTTTFEDLAKQLDKSLENKGKGFFKLIQDSRKLEMVRPIFLDAKSGIELYKVVKALETLVESNQLNRNEIAELIEAEVTELREQQEALTQAKNRLLDIPDEEVVKPSEKVANHFKTILIVGAVGISVGALGFKFLSSPLN